MIRLLSILITVTLLAGCVSAPVTLIVTDPRTGEPMNGMHAEASFPVFAIPFLSMPIPSRVEGVTDSEGRVTLTMKTHEGSGPYIRIFQNINDYYSSTSLTISKSYVENAAMHFSDTNNPFELNVQFLISAMPAQDACDIVVNVPNGYIGPVGVVMQQDLGATAGFMGAVKATIKINNELVIYSNTQINVPCDLQWLGLTITDEDGSIIEFCDPPDKCPQGEILLFPITGSIGSAWRTVTPGVKQYLPGGSNARYLYYIGSRNDLDEYYSIIGRDYECLKAEINRVLGDIPSQWYRR